MYSEILQTYNLNKENLKSDIIALITMQKQKTINEVIELYNDLFLENIPLNYPVLILKEILLKKDIKLNIKEGFTKNLYIKISLTSTEGELILPEVMYRFKCIFIDPNKDKTTDKNLLRIDLTKELLEFLEITYDL